MRHARPTVLVLMGLLALLVPSRTRAALVLLDGKTHTISAPSPGISVLNGTTLDVVPGASVVGVDATFNGILGAGPGTIVNISGGSVTGGNAFAAGINLTGGVALNVSGGTVTGGGAGSQPAIISNNSGPITISGGTFNGSVNLFMGTSSLNITNGLFNGGANIGADLGTTTISGGTFNGAIPLDIFGNAGSSTTISGGVFNTGFDFSLTDGGTVTFLGTNLSYLGGQISGTLSGGAALSSTILANEPFHVTVQTPTEIVFTGDPTPTGAPEPASLGMMAMGMVGVLGLAWRRRAS